METCPPEDDFCGITMFESKLEELTVHGIAKNCLPASVCESGSADINLGKKGRSRTSVFCCKDDACNRVSSAKLPLLNTKLNGLRCPACYASLSESCSDDTVDCVGPETQCIDLAGYIYFGEASEKIAMKGCATQSVCTASVGGAATFTGASSAITKLECKAATSMANKSPGSNGLFLSVIVWLLLAKL
ncbi:phospholipase A2 inhibitor and Ly6/PLAUR domain-containing protein-like [Hemicordylus capensis]|uniref:phospholipase A2 inhibitor and Ly6/PLAUR domain-containing protein-like n=1 Tax=Hemicordylus capensis TaxID=884348 RepID=UPI002302E124|nr:phospholipase A2 inhibitor and Ly6/PLAUR domain-containing protein-like [Hemicordylus capensis]